MRSSRLSCPNCKSIFPARKRTSTFEIDPQILCKTYKVVLKNGTQLKMSIIASDHQQYFFRPSIWANSNIKLANREATHNHLINRRVNELAFEDMSQFISQTELFPKQMLREIQQHESASWNEAIEGKKENKTFMKEFYELKRPDPLSVCGYDPSNTDFKADLKLILEIYTNSRLKMSQDKKIPTRQIYYCRNSGKDCFKVEAEIIDPHQYRILNDYRVIRHRDGCQVEGEDAEALRIYNLMMLKRDTIQRMMRYNNLFKKSPEAILCAISNTENAEYFYTNTIRSLENRKKLKKRFDNIINISIKKKLEDREGNQSLRYPEQNLDQQNQQHRPPPTYNDYQPKRIRVPLKAVVAKQQLDKQNESVSLENLGNPTKKIKIDRRAYQSISRSIQNYAKKGVTKQSQIYQESQSELSQFDANQAMEEIQDHSGWMISDNSIEPAIMAGERLRMDDLFASIRNSLIKSLERSSLKEIEENLGYKFD